MSTQGFWSNNPFAPTWRGALQLQWESSGGGDANGLCVKGCGVNILFHDISKEIRIHEAVQEEAEELAEFLQKWYRNTPRARCVVRAEWIRGCVAGKQSADYSAQKPWNHCLLARCARTHKLIGSIVQWNAGWLRMRDGTHWAGARCIDYLCVAGGWRSRGVARELLYAIHACAAQDAAAAGREFPPHLFCLEQTQLKIPPLSWTRMVCRASKPFAISEKKGIVLKHSSETAEIVWRAAALAGRICSMSPGWATGEAQGASTSVVQWNTDLFFLITDTFHITVPDGRKILTLDSIPRPPSAEELEEAVDSGLGLALDLAQRHESFLVLCSADWPRMHTDWKSDASVQWIVYNLQTGLIPDTRPPLLLL